MQSWTNAFSFFAFPFFFFLFAFGQQESAWWPCTSLHAPHNCGDLANAAADINKNQSKRRSKRTYCTLYKEYKHIENARLRGLQEQYNVSGSGTQSRRDYIEVRILSDSLYSERIPRPALVRSDNWFFLPFAIHYRNRINTSISWC